MICINYCLKLSGKIHCSNSKPFIFYIFMFIVGILVRIRLVHNIKAAISALSPAAHETATLTISLTAL